MSAITSLGDEARIVAANLRGLFTGDTTTLRLGVTGLSRAGKTVFITALVHNLVHGGRLPLFEAYSEGRLAEARLMPQPDDDVPRFDYEAHVARPGRAARLAATRHAASASSGSSSTTNPRAAEAHARARSAQPRHRRLSRRMAPRPRAPRQELCANGRPKRSRLSREPHRAELAAPGMRALASVDPAAPASEEMARDARRGLHGLSARRARRRARAVHAAARPLPHAGRPRGLARPHLRAARRAQPDGAAARTRSPR